MHKNRSISVYLSAILLFLTCVSVLHLTLPSVFADESIVDVVTINVPVSCSMSATGNTSHTATINNGQTTGNIGTTNLKVICNDNSGYAIYAIGYTDDTYGKTVLTSSTLGSTHDIATATTVTTGTSSWAMKLASVSGTYAPIIAGSSADTEKQTGDPDYTSYQAVPATYTKVAYHTSSTDTGNNATGSNLTTTYRAYISPTQPAGTYVGQVKYTLVHPYNRRAPGIPVNRQIQVTYDATNRGYFDDDPSVTTNVVTYDATCESEDKEYEVVKSHNLDDNGNKVSSLTTEDSSSEDIQISGASKLKIVLDYDLVFNEGNTLIEEDGNTYYENGAIYVCGDSCSAYYGTGTQTIIINDDEAYIELYIDSGVTINSAHDYGYYARIYPLDENDEEFTYKEYYDCTYTIISGTYKEPESTNSKQEWFCGWRDAGGSWGDEDDFLQNILHNTIENELIVDANYCR